MVRMGTQQSLTLWAEEGSGLPLRRAPSVVETQERESHQPLKISLTAVTGNPPKVFRKTGRLRTQRMAASVSED